MMRKIFNRQNQPILIGAGIAFVIIMIFTCIFMTSGSSALSSHNKPLTNSVVINRPTLHTKDTTIAQRRGFINKIGYPAIKAYQHHQNYQVLPSVVIAQAIVESNWGRSGLYLRGHNVFGVKGTYRGKSITMRTAEYINGHKIYEDAGFRYYPSIEDSILDHDQLLKYTFIRRNQDMSYQQDCRLLQQHGYATDPNYANTLIRTIQLYHLDRYDRIGLS